jgi:O-antigen ligase
VGTFGNRNHVGDYIAVCTCCWIWLAWGSRRDRTTGPWIIGAAIWKSDAARVAVTLVLLVGLFVSKSRTAIVLGICAAIVCVAVTRLTRRETPRYWGWVPAIALSVLAALLWLIGADPVTQRFGAGDLGGAADFRLLLARTTWDAARAFFPFGSGWGTFDLVYPRYQPPEIARFANHAHMDFLELLLEGGVLFLGFAGLFAVIAVRRVVALARELAKRHHATRDVILSAFCGIALLVVLAHSTVDFPLRIPANAILASLLAGAFLRPSRPHDTRKPPLVQQ